MEANCKSAKDLKSFKNCVELVAHLFGAGSDMHLAVLQKTNQKYNGQKVQRFNSVSDAASFINQTLGLSGTRFSTKNVKDKLIERSARQNLAKSDAIPGGPRSPPRPTAEQTAEIRRAVTELAEAAMEEGIDAQTAAQQGELPPQYFNMLVHEMQRIEEVTEAKSAALIPSPPVLGSASALRPSRNPKGRPPPPPRDPKGRPPPPPGRPARGRAAGTDPRLPVTPSQFTSLNNLSMEAMLDLIINGMSSSDLSNAIERFVRNVPELQISTQSQDPQSELLQDFDSKMKLEDGNETRIAANVEKLAENTAQLQQLRRDEDQRMQEQLELVTNLRELQASWEEFMNLGQTEAISILNDAQNEYNRLSSVKGSSSEFLTEADDILRELSSRQGFGKKMKKYKKMNKKKFRTY